MKLNLRLRAGLRVRAPYSPEATWNVTFPYTPKPHTFNPATQSGLFRSSHRSWVPRTTLSWVIPPYHPMRVDNPALATLGGSTRPSHLRKVSNPAIAIQAIQGGSPRPSHLMWPPNAVDHPALTSYGGSPGPSHLRWVNQPALTTYGDSARLSHTRWISPP
ncbi:hypothetical protein DPMN_009339 [Dreissena polymorpha]|uniref:Uncharacterized protein n=1 Tax=Dreissena polymorpha TaxID=45954 RepID=A0A9D4RZZ1_DREPO|nr:hypothetical protein DPMN_009339 [Dreissena polymorpha]